VRKSVVISGSPRRVETLVLSEKRRVFVRCVTTELSAPNGASNMKPMESGEDLFPTTEKRFATKET